MEILKRIAYLVKPYWTRLAAAALLSLIISGFNGGLAWLVKPAIDGIFIKKDPALLSMLSVGVLVLYILRGVFSFFQAYLMRSAGSKVLRDIRNNLYEHIMFLPYNEFKKESSGHLLSRVINDAGQLEGLLAYAIKDVFVESATVVVLLSVAFYRRWDLTLISLAVLPGAFYGIKKLGKRLKKVSTEGQKKISMITEFLSETFSGIKMVKIFGREGTLAKLFKDKNQGYYRELMRSTRIIEFTSLIIDMVGGLGIAFVIWYGGKLVIGGDITPGEFFSFLVAIVMVFTPVRRLSAANNRIQQTKAYLERLDEIFQKERELSGPAELPLLREHIELRGINFKYPTSKHHVLTDINLKVRKGEILAIVGRSGAGKTSIIDLIPRFHDPIAGAVLIDGVNILEVTLPSLRKQIGLVSQDIILFNDTVMANIAFGSPGATEDDVIKAAKAAYSHDFILELPKGYDTIIGERGIMISGGQRQRISIARAILKNPPILILDEATSSLDTESEMIVQKALDKLMENRTTFVIAHRLSTIQKADRIIVLEKGRIKEIGSHDELLSKDGIYKKLYDLQLSSAGGHAFG